MAPYRSGSSLSRPNRTLAFETSSPFRSCFSVSSAVRTDVPSSVTRLVHVVSSPLLEPSHTLSATAPPVGLPTITGLTDSLEYRDTAHDRSALCAIQTPCNRDRSDRRRTNVLLVRRCQSKQCRIVQLMRRAIQPAPTIIDESCVSLCSQRRSAETPGRWTGKSPARDRDRMGNLGRGEDDLSRGAPPAS